MSVEIKKLVPTRKELRRFVDFGISLYSGNSCYVPPLRIDDIQTLLPEKNPAFDFCRAQAFMAYRDGKPAGKIVAIVAVSDHIQTEHDQIVPNPLLFRWKPDVQHADLLPALPKIQRHVRMLLPAVRHDPDEPYEE